MPDYKKELEEFAYIVSHDLGAPLRHVKSFDSLLIKKLEDKITDEEREYFQYLESSVLKTESMLEALLQYSRLNTQGEEFKTFACHKLVTSVISNFWRETDGTGAKINTLNLPGSLNGDEKQIRKLFTHLIDNALKFKRPNIKPNITISAEEKDNTWHFSIRDNGIGIPQEQCENVFTMFKQLNPDQYPSSMGCGLTFAKNIVERHGGKIWIEPNSDQGVTVQFDIAV